VHQIGEIGRIPAQLPLTPFSLRLWGDCACVSCLVRVPCALKRENETDQVVFDLRIADPRRVSVCVPLHVRCTRPERGWFVATTHTRIPVNMYGMYSGAGTVDASSSSSSEPPSACLVAGATDGIGLDFCIAAASQGPVCWLPVDSPRIQHAGE
jgi:hypothetical protein